MGLSSKDPVEGLKRLVGFFIYFPLAFLKLENAV